MELLKEKLSKLEDKKNAVESEINSLQQKVEDNQLGVQNAKDRAKSAKDTAKTTERRLSEFELRFNSLEEKFQQQYDKIETMKTSVSDLDKSMKTRMKSLKSEVEGSRKELKADLEEIKSMLSMLLLQTGDKELPRSHSWYHQPTGSASSDDNAFPRATKRQMSDTDLQLPTLQEQPKRYPTRSQSMKHRKDGQAVLRTDNLQSLIMSPSTVDETKYTQAIKRTED